MSNHRLNKPKKGDGPVLLNPPLLEAIFEVRWELEQDGASGRFRDPSYPMMYGRIYEKMKKDLPFLEDLPSTQVHPEANPYLVRHRMRKEKESWPLIQVGPGVLTVNETHDYSWTAFRSLIGRSIEAIQELYPTGGLPLNFIKSEIRYVNGVQFDPFSDHPVSFLAEKLHTKLDIDPEIFELNGIQDNPVGLGLNLLYPTKAPLGQFGLSFNLGQVENRSAYIVQSMIQSIGETVPQDRDSFVSWLNLAHDVAENCFQTLFRGALMAKFGSLEK